jgi:hypothetical protein
MWCWPGRMETGRLHRRKKRKSWILNYLFKHLFRKNGGCGACIFTLKHLVLCLVRNEPNLNYAITLSDTVLTAYLPKAKGNKVGVLQRVLIKFFIKYQS